MTENILIGSLRRSGGTLLARLLDGHAECNVLPFETWNTRTKARFRWGHHLLFRALSPRAKLHVCGLDTPYRKKVSGAIRGLVWEDYRGDLLRLAADCQSQAVLYRAAAELYFARTHSGPLRSKLVNHCANLCTLTPPVRDRIFGPHHLVLTVRDPRAIYSSLEHHQRPTRFAKLTLDRFCDEWEALVTRYPAESLDTTTLCFEDLLREPEKTMQTLCSNLGIAFDPVVVHPTVLGDAASANSSFERCTGIDRTAIDSWRAHIAPEAAAYIESRLKPHLERLGYV